VSPTFCATSEGILNRESTRSRGHSPTAFTTETRGDPFFHAGTVRKMFTCADGSGTFTILFHPQFTPATPAGCGEAGPFAVIGGTGDYAQLRGHGDFCVFAVGEDEFSEAFTGTFGLR
jgi:hypothetical protein